MKFVKSNRDIASSPHGLAAQLGQLEPQKSKTALVADLALLLSPRELVTISELMVSVSASLRLPLLLSAPVQSVIVERLVRPPFILHQPVSPQLRDRVDIW